MKIMDEANVMIRYDIIQKPYNDFKSLIFILFLIFVPFSIVIKRLIVRQNDIISTSKFFCR